MYTKLIEDINKRVADLTKFTDDSFMQHHQIRGRLMEATEIRNFLVARAAEEEKTAAAAKASKPKKVKATKGKAKKGDAPSNVTPMTAKAAKANG